MGVEDDGRLIGEAITEYQDRYPVHPDTQIKFDGYQLPLVPEIRKAAIELHGRVPALKFISWDFTVDDQNRVILIETNLHSQTSWIVQHTHGKAFFGDDTAQLLQEVGRRCGRANH